MAWEMFLWPFLKKQTNKTLCHTSPVPILMLIFKLGVFLFPIFEPMLNPMSQFKLLNYQGRIFLLPRA